MIIPEWVKLDVLDTWQRDNTGFVHFRAFYRVNGELGILEEKSDFVREPNAILLGQTEFFLQYLLTRFHCVISACTYAGR